VTKRTIPNGTIVLRGGTIAAIGQNVRVPAGADVVDATRRFVSPGIIDCHSRERANGPKVPGELAKAGVTSAFESAGLTDPKDFVRNAAKAVKAGLSADAALRAMTIGAAAIAGVADHLGSIERGKTANLIVTDGDLFDEKTKITRVFVEGRSIAIDLAASAPSGRGRGRGRGF